MKNAEEQTLSLKLLVEKENNQVVFAESNKDFIDVLFSFMTIPIGTIINLTGENLSKGDIGCLSNFYASVQNLDVKFLQSKKCKEMLSQPRSAAEFYCKNLKVNLMEGYGSEYYACGDSSCEFLSFYRTSRCCCGEQMAFEIKLPSSTVEPKEDAVFMRSGARFMISDEFYVRPMSTIAGLTLLSKLGKEDGSTLEERTVKVGRNEVMELLKCSLVSRTPMSETFLGQLPGRRCTNLLSPENGPPIKEKGDLSMFMDRMYIRKKRTKICLKLIINTGNNEVLYAEAEEDFVDLLCSFLTFPLGYLFENFPSLSYKGCTDNLYKSIEDLHYKYFESTEMQRFLLRPQLAPGLACSNQLTRITEAVNTSRFSQIRSDLSLMSKLEEPITSKGFIKGPIKFMVMDDLTVMPLSTMSGLSLINAAQIPLVNITEQEASMGEDEALRLFKASFVSSNALTEAFILKEPTQERQ